LMVEPTQDNDSKECTSMIILSASIFGGLYGLLLIIVIYMCVKYSKEKPKEWENVNAFVRNLEQQRER
jgi:cytochrome bd-type quinol oxidase subunit 1